MRIGNPSPLRQVEVSTDDLAKFRTVEEENKFRKFIWESNPDYATAIDLDLTNEEGAKGILNNPTIQKAFKEFGKDYTGFLMEETKYVMQEATVKLMEKADVVYGKEQALATAEFRDVTEPFGFDKEGNPFYFDYDTWHYLAKEGKIKKGGVGLYRYFVHYDVRGFNARWKGKGVKDYKP